MSDETGTTDEQAADVQPVQQSAADQAPSPFTRVRYTPPPSTHTPVVSVDGVLYTMEQLTATPTLGRNPGIRWWHGGSEQDIPTGEANALATLPGFFIVGPGTAPGGRTP